MKNLGKTLRVRCLKMKTYTCDRCGDVIPSGELKRIVFQYQDNTDGFIHKEIMLIKECKDVCNFCYMESLKFLENEVK